MREKGITLIALVITIIILLLLASVTVATLTGDNGIITKAMEARKKTEEAELDEQLKLAQLSAKLNKQGGAVTLDDILAELEKQGVEHEKEGNNSIIIGGSHIFDFEEESNGEVSWENQGTTTMPKPKVVSVEIIERTDTKIKVKVTTIRNAGGILIYSIKEDEGAYQEVTRTTQATTADPIEEEYTFIIDSNKLYSEIKVEALAKNGETASNAIDLVKIPALTNRDVVFSYEVKGQPIQKSEYTKEPVTVKASVKNVDTTGYILQYSQTDPEVGAIWKEYNANGVEFTNNGNLYIRLSDGKQGGKYATTLVNNIDTLLPKQFTPTVTAEIDRITITGSTTDQEATATSANSGIIGYSFSKDGGLNWVPAEGTIVDTSYPFEDLQPDNLFNLKMKAVDKVGNETITEGIEQKTTKLEIDLQSPSNWTNDSVTVTVTTKPENLVEKGYTIEYSTDGNKWDPYPSTGVPMDANGAVHARVKNAKGTILRKCNKKCKYNR